MNEALANAFNAKIQMYEGNKVIVEVDNQELSDYKTKINNTKAYNVSIKYKDGLAQKI